MPTEVDRMPVQSFAALGEVWRALEAGAPHSFFQSWTWVGCLAEERYPDPVLLQATRDGRIVGLALFNRRSGRLHLGETGEAERDRPFTEHNGPLATDPEAAAALLRAAMAAGGAGLVLGGVPPSLVEATGGVVVRLQRRDAPFVDLDAVRAAGSDPLARLSANARYQLRRSHRFYKGDWDRLEVDRAGSVAELDAWFEELARLHEATWSRRGRPGAFATPYLRRFHRALMGQALARDELDLLRVSGPGGAVGFLYNVRHLRVVYAYQSGLADPTGQPHAKPGLTCHALAIELAAGRGDLRYDLLAGDQRYKRSLADRSVPLVWAELASPFSIRAFAGCLRALAGRLRGGGGVVG